MSKAISALEGATGGDITRVREKGLQGMVTLRGDLASGPLKSAVKSVTGHDVPGHRGIHGGLGGGVAWMSPDELMVFCDYDHAEAQAQALTVALAGQHHLAVNVSDARVVLSVSGGAAREVMAKLAPVDLAPGQFEPGEIRRTRLAQIPAAFWMPDGETFHVVAFRSVAQYAFDLLTAAAADGSAVGHF